jgi:hypothetical protein
LGGLARPKWLKRREIANAYGPYLASNALHENSGSYDRLFNPGKHRSDADWHHLTYKGSSQIAQRPQPLCERSHEPSLLGQGLSLIAFEPSQAPEQLELRPLEKVCQQRVAEGANAR